MPELARLCTYEKIAACAGGAGVWGCFGLNPGGVEVLLPRPFGERAGVRGLDVGDAAGRDVRPAAQSLSFVSPKESNQRKGDPTGRVPPLRCGQPAMLGRGAALRNSLRACALRSNNRSESEHEAWACCAAHARPTPCASRHGQRGGEAHTGHRCARPWLVNAAASRGVLFYSPSRWRERAGVRANPSSTTPLRRSQRPPLYSTNTPYIVPR